MLWNAFDRYIVSLACKSLDANPEEWTFTHYEAKSEKLGLTVWFANGIFALHIKTREGYQLGGVSFFASFLGWFTWRARVMRAVRRAQKHQFMMSRGFAGRD